jgi:hypothetical protein
LGVAAVLRQVIFDAAVELHDVPVDPQVAPHDAGTIGESKLSLGGGVAQVDQQQSRC